jgi:tRNA pseudouridine55 synthase
LGIGLAAGISRGDGILNVNKARGWTSHDVVAKLRRVLRGAKIGHAGTLDPAATGVLPVLVGKATRIAEYLIDWDKEYRAVMRLGDSTDTQDATGVILRTRLTHHLTEEIIREAVAQFQGRLAQMPPMYSAVKVGGVPLYKAARAGRTVEREPREVTIHRIEVLGIDGRDVSLCIECSKGTYVRTLCADIGEALGVGGHLLALERRRVGPLTLERALSIEDIEARLLVDRLGEVLVSLDDALRAIPPLILDRPTSDRVLHGVPVPAAAVALGGHDGTGSLRGGAVVRLKDPAGQLIALGRIPAGGLSVGGTKDGMPGAVRILKVLVDV